ncbi:hypothetical protein DFQ01_10611 [Paenibacillus cellulosilyticus]|uniref:Uncharacterized protein n=1 Tax=Paenibacillus cellulosilyticus TaxID=375489 RepID=A0A2V2YUF6_9BACL|nr:hypothetical protein [Paenibacillus cellulosilyticus]PWW04730.1 hypothetical protein DFQ01_10611 [Paenibacillus cellulosilyticus]QKS45855.1 hypothetical protein HUB94_16460 [Paenibacillus cellulosilyticus]
MLNDVVGQLVVAEQVQFNIKEKFHNVHHVYNHVNVPTFPAAVVTEVLVKLLFPESKSGEVEHRSPAVVVRNVSGKILSYVPLQPILNMRPAGRIPGIDMIGHIRFPVIEEGIYEYALEIEDRPICKSYITVSEG